MSSESMREAALEYWGRGWSIVPMLMAEKKPARKWKRFQSEPAPESALRAWFGSISTYGVAVVFGAVSGGLASRDFDTMTGYEAWAGRHPDLAQSLPTVVTRRGRHVYFRAAPESVIELRKLLGKPGTGAIACENGELRAGVGCYSVLPPSVHPSGHIYRWAIPLTEELPTLDVLGAGFVEVPVRRPTYSPPAPVRDRFRPMGHGSVLERARRYLAQLPPGIDGHHGSKPTFRAACVLVRGFDLTTEEAIPLLREFSERCQPPWSEQELQHKLRSADNWTGQRGHLLQAAPQPFRRRRFRSATVERSHRHAVMHRLRQRRRTP